MNERDSQTDPYPFPDDKDGFVGGITPLGGSFSYVAAVNGQTIDLVSAHELGHQLLLSTVNTTTYHDKGPFPTDKNGKNWRGLMKKNYKKSKTTEWLRGVDWKAANDKAKTLLP